MRDFNPQVLGMFGIMRHYRVTRAYGAYICETPLGLKIIKESHESEGELLFAHSVKEHLYQSGFRCIDRYCVTEEGLPYVEFNKELLTVRNWIGGDEAELESLEDAMLVARQLGQMHTFCTGLDPMEGSRISMRWYGVPERMEKRLRQMQGFCKMVRRSSRYTDFDLLFLDHFQEHYDEAKEASELMSGPEYQSEAHLAETQWAFGHNNYSNHCVYKARGQLLIAGFEKSCFMLPILDFVKLYEKILRKYDWDYDIGMRILEEYEKCQKLNPWEEKILFASLLFPERFWILAEAAYSSKRNWIPQVYWRKLEEITEQKNQRQHFLRRFRMGLGL